MHLKTEDIYDLLNGVKEKRELMIEHINNCRQCRKLFEIRKEMIFSLKNIEKINVPSGFSRVVLEKIEIRNKIIKRLSYVITTIPILFLAFFLLSFSILGINGEELKFATHQYFFLTLKTLKFLIKFAMGLNKIISSIFDLVHKLSSIYSDLSILPFLFIMFIFGAFLGILFLSLINNHFPLRGVRDETN